ncbi:DNA alkylation repair protein [Ciceribacter sp. L1K22]|uniref:DNA alkylation repair protein n=1 Tax=Ciceribacter sp. L1K22 TaxID=2820275 RepID=UPI001ABE4CBE|nr:DNA alkylation repair protein [Ciceribacter sp. L1K22]MBO3761203.1 DNA alkylation repair protein [Ciceribacter sp. L1K22]
MPEPLKNLISATTARDTADALSRTWPDFDRDAFLELVLPTLNELELMQRSQSISAAMQSCLPDDFEAAADLMEKCLPSSGGSLSGWALLAFNQYIAARGLGHLERSLDLLKALTPHFTAEFGIRPFIHAEQERALEIISGWTRDPNHHVRRLASEGTRPRLPWAMRLPELVRNPTPILPILEAMLDDPEDYVRRSVANSLNDIAKDHPDAVADFVERHRQDASPERMWLLKHASRTLIKKGHGKALANFGYEAVADIVATLTVATETIVFPGELAFAVSLTNSGDKRRTVMMDYVLHHQKKGGSLTPKVFKGKSLSIASGETVVIEKRHGFRPITTRIYYPGRHRLEILANGGIVAGADFELIIGDE